MQAGGEVGPPPSAGHRVLDHLRSPASVTTALAFALLAAVMVSARRLAELSFDDAGHSWMLLRAITNNPLLVGAFLLLAAANIRGATVRALRLRWRDLDRGRELRAFAGVLGTFLTWRHLADDYDYVFGSWHSLDRLVLLAAFAAMVWRPIALLLFVAQVQVLQMPLRSAFEFPGGSLDDLPILALASITAAVLAAAALDTSRTHTVVSLISASIASQFFHSGLSKIRIDWLAENEPSNIPLNGFGQGWLGAGDGEFAADLSDLLAMFHWPVLLGTLALEVGAIVLIVRRRFLLAGLAGWSIFHFFVFLGFGFSFLEWAIVELGLAALLLRERGLRWAAPALTVAPVALSVVSVWFGSRVFEPPNLTWIDGPITYAYEYDAIDGDGNQRVLVANDFAPHEAVFAFGLLHLGPTPPTAAGYGALTESHNDLLADVTSMDEIQRIEATLPTHAMERGHDRTVDHIGRFLLASGRHDSAFDVIPEPFSKVSTSRAGQDHERGSELIELSITRVTTLRVGEEREVRREPVVTFRVVGDKIEVEWAT